MLTIILNGMIRVIIYNTEGLGSSELQLQSTCLQVATVT